MDHDGTKVEDVEGLKRIVLDFYIHLYLDDGVIIPLHTSTLFCLLI